jgi:hypothetical protein
MSLNTGVSQHSPPLKEISSRDYEHRGGYKRGYTRITVREEPWIIGAEEILGLPCILFLGIMAPLNLIKSNRPSPHDSVLLTQKLHWMLWIEQVGIKRRDIVNNDIDGRLQTFFQLRDVEHVMHTCQGWRQLQSVCHNS